MLEICKSRYESNLLDRLYLYSQDFINFILIRRGGLITFFLNYSTLAEFVNSNANISFN
jgi:hypothetical protein